jgi:hypothetical protein
MRALLVLFIVLGSFGSRALGADDLQWLKDSKLPYRIESRLRVNRDPSFRAIIFKNEDEGVKDLQSLALKETQEELWLYLPSKTLWIEIGIEESAVVGSEKSVAATVDPDPKMLQLGHAEDLDAVLYHIHPRILETRAFEIWSRREAKAKRPHSRRAREFLKLSFAAKNLLPSEGDFMSLFEFHISHEILLENLGIAAEVTSYHRVVTPLGAMEYRVKKRLGAENRDSRILAAKAYAEISKDFDETLDTYYFAGARGSSLLKRVDVHAWLEELSERSPYIELKLFTSGK